MTRARDLADSADKDIAGTLTLDAVNASGVITGLTVEATGDTAAGDNAAMGYTAAEGLILTGQGSTGDITIKNDADAVVLQVPTGTTNVNVIGSIDVATNAVIDGTALVTGVLTTTAATVSNGGGQFNGAINVGVDDTGYDVKFFGATASAFMQWDASADDLILGGVSRLGIGTSPACNFHIKGDNPRLRVEGDDNTVKFDVFMNDTNALIGTSTNHALTFMTNDAEKMRLDSSGNVGIGTTATTAASSTKNIFLGGTGNIYADAAASADASLSISQNAKIDTDNSWEYIVTDEASNYYQNAGNHVWRYAASGSAGADISWSEAMRINSSGFVGIGTSSPSAGLTIQAADGSTSGTIMLTATSVASAGMACNASGLNFGADTGGFVFKTGASANDPTDTGTTRVSISSNGTQEFTASATAAVSGGTGILNIIAATARSSGNGPFIGFRVPNSTGGTTHEDMGVIGFLSPDSTDGNRLADFIITTRNTSVSEKFRIAANGQITATDTSISSNSDSRLKKDIVDYTYDLAKFKSYDVKKFNWKHPEFHMGKTNQIGFLAQDLQSVDSQWVSQVPLQPKDENGDAHVEAQYLDEDLVSLTSKLGEKDAMYVSIIQQLIDKVETLEAKVTALEG